MISLKRLVIRSFFLGDTPSITPKGQGNVYCSRATVRPKIRFTSAAN